MDTLPPATVRNPDPSPCLPPHPSAYLSPQRWAQYCAALGEQASRRVQARAERCFWCGRRNGHRRNCPVINP